MTSGDGSYYENQKTLSHIISKVSLWAREKMFHRIMDYYQPNQETKVLDVGVTTNQRIDSNFFEKLYPYSHNLTACGLEDASFLENQYPGLTFIQGNGSVLPFPDKSFDLVVSFAVLEHVGNADHQQQFIQELCRVGTCVCITTPNRWYPIEFHTVLPLVHWLPAKYFRALLRLLGQTFYAQEENLNLLGEKDIKKLFPNLGSLNIFRFRLLGMTSNYLVFYSP